jgi:hypothetical protein
MTRYGSVVLDRLSREPMYRRIAAGVVIGIFAVGWALPAAAYRPFDGTDAAVADVGEVEIEFQPLGAAHAGGTTKGLTDAILNYGFADRWELVLQSTPQVPPEGFGPISVSNGAFLKYVLQPGVLQEKSGPSFATEFGVLLPEVGGSGVGASWAGIMSQRWDWAPSISTSQLISPLTNTPKRLSTPSSKGRTNGRSDRSRSSISTTFSMRPKRTPPWSEPFGK